MPEQSIKLDYKEGRLEPDPSELEEVELDAYVLPAIGSWQTYIDADPDEYAKEFGDRDYHKLSLQVHTSGKELTDGELAYIADELEAGWNKYFHDMGQAHYSLTRNIKKLAASDLAIGGTWMYMSLTIRSPIGGAFGIGFVALIWGLGMVSGLNWAAKREKVKRCNYLGENLQDVKATQASDPAKQEMLSEIENYFESLDGTERNLYEELKEFCEEKGYEGPARGYSLLSEKKKPLIFKYWPMKKLGGLKKFLLGTDVPSPSTLLPDRNLRKELKSE